MYGSLFVVFVIFGRSNTNNSKV